jgi:hypothetical protein
VLGVSIGIVLADLQLSKYWSNICHPMGGPYTNYTCITHKAVQSLMPKLQIEQKTH